MANTFAPFGFSAIGPFGQSPTTGAMTEYQILYSYSTAIYRGDPVLLSGGYVQRGAAGNTAGLLGIFAGCEYLNSAIGHSVWSPTWPGAGVVANTIVKAYIIDDPFILIMAQSGTGGPVPQSDIGANIDLNLGTGNASTGLSGAYADFSTIGTTSTLPFRIVGLTQGNAGNGGDNTSAGNLVLLTWNNHWYKQLTGA